MSLWNQRPLNPPIGGEVHLWTLRDPGHGPPAAALDWLSGPELAAYTRWRTVARRREYLLGRLLLRQVLAAYLDRPAREVPLQLSPRGKPCLPDPALQFSLSHAQGGYVVALTTHSPIGVDIEALHRRVSHTYVAQVFTEAEQAFLAAAPAGKARERQFFHIWTRKEALWKALDAPPPLRFRDISVTFPADSFQVTLPGWQDARRWFADTFSPFPGYLLSYAVARHQPGPPLRQHHCLELTQLFQ